MTGKALSREISANRENQGSDATGKVGGLAHAGSPKGSGRNCLKTLPRAFGHYSGIAKRRAPPQNRSLPACCGSANSIVTPSDTGSQRMFKILFAPGNDRLMPGLCVLDPGKTVRPQEAKRLAKCLRGRPYWAVNLLPDKAKPLNCSQAEFFMAMRRTYGILFHSGQADTVRHPVEPRLFRRCRYPYSGCAIQAEPKKFNQRRTQWQTNSASL